MSNKLGLTLEERTVFYTDASSKKPAKATSVQRFPE